MLLRTAAEGRCVCRRARGEEVSLKEKHFTLMKERSTPYQMRDRSLEGERKSALDEYRKGEYVRTIKLLDPNLRREGQLPGPTASWIVPPGC